MTYTDEQVADALYALALSPAWEILQTELSSRVERLDRKILEGKASPEEYQRWCGERIGLNQALDLPGQLVAKAAPPPTDNP